MRFRFECSSLSVSLALLLCTAGAAGAQSRCGVERWPVKIAADDDASRVDTLPVATTVAELVQIPRPGGTFDSRRRVGPIELHVFVLRARLARVIVEDDSDLHLVLRDLEDDRKTLVAEIPHPGCTADRVLGARFEAARQALRRVPRDGLVEVIGIGFFDSLHGQSGMARNGFELHPVLSLRSIQR